MRHGGNLDEAARLFGRPVDDWLDLSTGINPDPYPAPAFDAATLARLPRADEVARLEDAARVAYGVPDGAAIAAAPGTQAIIQWLPRLVPAPVRVAVAAPTYGEHAPAWRAGGHRVGEVAPTALADLSPEEPTVAVACNPNNPDGHVTAPDALLALATRLGRSGGFLVVDEAFADVDPAVSVLPRLRGEPVVALRSFGKFFGLAGVRLGFAAGAAAPVERLREALGPWCVAGPAIAIGTAALADRAWQAAERARLAAAAAALDETLAAAGLQVVGGTALYRLAAHAEAGRIADRLAEEGVWVRRFPDRPRLLRFGLPPAAGGAERLARALAMASGR